MSAANRIFELLKSNLQYDKQGEEYLESVANEVREGYLTADDVEEVIDETIAKSDFPNWRYFRKLCRAIPRNYSRQSNRYGDRDTFDCHRCQDTSLVTVVHPDSYETVRQRGEDAPLKTMVVPCICPRGRIEFEKTRRVGDNEFRVHYYQFSATLFFPISEFSGGRNMKMLVDWVADFGERKKETRPSYVKEFAEF